MARPAAASASTTAWRVVSESWTATRDIRCYFVSFLWRWVGEGGRWERVRRRRRKSSEQRSSVEREREKEKKKRRCLSSSCFSPCLHAPRALFAFFLWCSRTHLGLELVLGKVEDGPCELEREREREMMVEEEERWTKKKKVESKGREKKNQSTCRFARALFQPSRGAYPIPFLHAEHLHEFSLT